MTDLYEMDDCLIAPLRNDTDSLNAAQLSRRILSHLESRPTRKVLFDFSAVSVLDRKTYQTIMECTAMVRLMGAETVFSCIQPGVASALVDLDLDCDIKTCFSIEEGMQALSHWEENQAQGVPE